MTAQNVLPWLKDIKERPDREQTPSGRLDAYTRYMNQMGSLNTVVEMMLSEARDATGADGGTVYLVTTDGRLRFVYFQNDTFSRGIRNQRDHYINAEIPLDEHSIAGYCAITKQTLNIADVSHIAPDAPYYFNTTFDDSSGYNTVSMLTVPMTGSYKRSIAVLQLVNSLGPNACPQPFGRNDTLYAKNLVVNTSPYIERALQTLNDIDAMMAADDKRSRLRRVGAYAAEIYEAWATRQGVADDDLMLRKDRLHLYAMMREVSPQSASSHADHHDRHIIEQITQYASALSRADEDQVTMKAAEAGGYFDDELAKAAANIAPTLRAIASRYGDSGTSSSSGKKHVFIG